MNKEFVMHVFWLQTLLTRYIWGDAYGFEKITLTTEMGQNWPDDNKEQIKFENEGVREDRTTVGEEKRERKDRFFE